MTFAIHGHPAYNPASPLHETYCRAILGDLNDDELAKLIEIANDPATKPLRSERLAKPGLGDVLRCVDCITRDTPQK